MLNKVILMGRLTANPELKQTPSGTEVVSFSIAVERNFKDGAGKKITDFINAVAWRNTAVFINRYFNKGSMIALEGSLQTRSYEDKNGNKRAIVEVLAEQVYFAGGKQADGFNEADFEEIEPENVPF